MNCCITVLACFPLRGQPAGASHPAVATNTSVLITHTSLLMEKDFFVMVIQRAGRAGLSSEFTHVTSGLSVECFLAERQKGKMLCVHLIWKSAAMSASLSGMVVVELVCEGSCQLEAEQL